MKQGTTARAIAASGFILVAAAAQANANVFVETFDDPVVLAPTQTPGAWYTDRYAPAVFENAFFDGDNRLRHGVREGDQQANRPAGFGSDFYNYQGRKFDIGSSVNTAVGIDIYVDSTWQAGTRAGFWTTMANNNNTFPIIEYVVDAEGYTGFRWWQSGLGWTTIPAFENPAADEWYSLQIELTSADVNFSINGVGIGTVDNLGAESIANVILNVHNQGIAGEYDVYWDNFTLIPTPGAVALFGLAGLAAARRRR